MSHVSFDQLPPDTQARIQGRAGPDLATFSYGPPDSERSSKYLIVLLTIVWLLAVTLLTFIHLWPTTESIVIGVITLAGILFSFRSIYSLVIDRSSGRERSAVVTPMYFIDLDRSLVSFWRLDEVAGFDVSHKYEGGQYKYSVITVGLEGNKTFVVTGLDAAEQFVDDAQLLRKSFIEASARNDVNFSEKHEIFRDLAVSEGSSSQSEVRTAIAHLAVAGAAIVVTAGIMVAALAWNEYYDDKRSWEASQAANRASTYRAYIQTHPRGRWVNDANAGLQALYDSADEKYQSSLNAGHDPKAAETISQILKYAKTTQNYRVRVSFTRKLEIPLDLEDQIKQEFEVKKVLPLGDALSDEKMAIREARLVSLIGEAFNEVIPDDIIEIASNCTDTCVDLAIEYDVDLKNSIYYDLRQKNVPSRERIWYPGILIQWNCTARIPNGSEIYKFDLESMPASTITYDSNSDEIFDVNEDFAKVLASDKGNVYDSMVASAFDDFKAYLIYRMGIGEEPIRKEPDPDPEDLIPTPSQPAPKSRK